jgi:hypothetical protein
MIIKGGFEMETVIIVGVVWISLLALGLWLNYRFHQSNLANNDQGFILESPASTDSNDKWSREQKLSRGY